MKTVGFLLNKGVDAKVSLGIEPQPHRDVSVRDWFDEDSDPEFRLACRQWDTPAGTTRAVMRCTPESGYLNGIPLCSDLNVSRGVESLVKGRDDLPRLRWLLGEPDAESIAAFRETARARKTFAAERGVLVPHLDSLVEAEVDIINCIRPFPGGINDMRLLKRRVGERLCLWGGVNPEEDIERATVTHIRRAVIDVMLAAAAGGGFVLSPGGSSCDPEPYDNVIAFIQAALEFGQYPIDTARLEAELGRIGSA